MQHKMTTYGITSITTAYLTIPLSESVVNVLVMAMNLISIHMKVAILGHFCLTEQKLEL